MPDQDVATGWHRGWCDARLDTSRWCRPAKLTLDRRQLQAKLGADDVLDCVSGIHATPAQKAEVDVQKRLTQSDNRIDAAQIAYGRQ